MLHAHAHTKSAPAAAPAGKGEGAVGAPPGKGAVGAPAGEATDGAAAGTRAPAAPAALDWEAEAWVPLQFAEAPLGALGFDALGDPTATAHALAVLAKYAPEPIGAEVVELNDGLLVRFSLSGCARGDITLSHDKHHLVVEAARAPVPALAGARERWTGRATRVVTTGGHYSLDKASVNLKDGLLTVFAPRKETIEAARAPRRAVNIGGE
jgi:HSP20 family molecular chaperone IbpA